MCRRPGRWCCMRRRGKGGMQGEPLPKGMRARQNLVDNRKVLVHEVFFCRRGSSCCLVPGDAAGKSPGAGCKADTTERAANFSCGSATGSERAGDFFALD